MNDIVQLKTKFTIGVFAIVFDEYRRVLLCHRRDFDLWNLPGGGLEASESPWAGVIREVREEVGIMVKVERLTGVYHKAEDGEIVFAFLCCPVNGTLTLTEEADEIAYFALDDIPANTSRKQVERIRDAPRCRADGEIDSCAPGATWTIVADACWPRSQMIPVMGYIGRCVHQNPPLAASRHIVLVPSGTIGHTPSPIGPSVR